MGGGTYMGGGHMGGGHMGGEHMGGEHGWGTWVVRNHTHVYVHNSMYTTLI